MNENAISNSEALSLIGNLFNKPILPRVFGNGVLVLEIGEVKSREVSRSNGEKTHKELGDYSLMIAGGWTISNGQKQINSEDFTEDNYKLINDFIADSEIIDFDMVDTKNPIRFMLSNNVEIFIQNPNPNSLGHFFVDFRDGNNCSVELNQSRVFVKKPRI